MVADQPAPEPAPDPLSLAEVVRTETVNATAALVAGPENQDIFSSADDANHAYARNQSLWADADLSCIPVASSGVLVTPDILIHAAHNPSSGTIYFVDASNQTHARQIGAGVGITDTDLFISRLSAPLPASVIPAKVLPLSAYVGPSVKLTTASLVARRLLAAFTRQSRTLHIATAIWIQPNSDVVRAAGFESWYAPIVGGDSGYPCLLIIDGQAVALCCWYQSDGSLYSYGPSISSYIPQINAAIASLGSSTSLNEIDLSAYPNYP